MLNLCVIYRLTYCSPPIHCIYIRGKDTRKRALEKVDAKRRFVTFISFHFHFQSFLEGDPSTKVVFQRALHLKIQCLEINT